MIRRIFISKKGNCLHLMRVILYMISQKNETIRGIESLTRGNRKLLIEAKRLAKGSHYKFPRYTIKRRGNTAQKMKFYIKDFFSKCDQVHLLKKSLMENFFFCVALLVYLLCTLGICNINPSLVFWFLQAVSCFLQQDSLSP